ncbi:hypothetical protein K2173_010876 [Erythroxylum novogranatense]|uniref:Bifunctional inhibitor/plant lipid transfer protein/seed storage helical domain-containing protein n=1 Tax=Erythroxylum novogranatense TaxID=1862640 RepID=A0AAV8T1A4_9ROSI|nr:hypothetical protein K2173_010876 [Erythroxylum novogranatense]
MGSQALNLATRCILVLVLLSMASSDVQQDRAECTEQLVSLSTCLPFVGGQSKAPTLDCCSGLKQVLGKSKKCLCILIRDRDDPSLGLKINGTLAAGLPNTCHAPANVSECIDILHISPSSQEAKIFEIFGNFSKGSTKPSATTGNVTSSSSSSEVKSSSEKARGKLGVEMICGLLLWTFRFILY